MTAPRDGLSPDSFCGLLTMPFANSVALCLHFKGSFSSAGLFFLFFFFFFALVAKGEVLAWWART